MIKNKIVFCQICGKCLGEEVPNYAKDHLKLFPNHKSFLVKTLYDPLLLDKPDDWFKHHIPLMKNNYQQPMGNTKKTTDNETEPEIRFCYVFGCFGTVTCRLFGFGKLIN
ncbi:MAG: hypothetical protein ACREAK_09425, partial [Nitrosarchaeum sp.]